MEDHTMETIGCDLGDRQSELCILLPSGEVDHPEAVKTNREAFARFFTRPRAHVVIEVGTHSRWVSKLLGELGHRVTVANPRRVKLISQGHSKRDVKDAELLARLGRADKELLSPLRRPLRLRSGTRTFLLPPPPARAWVYLCPPLGTPFPPSALPSAPPVHHSRPGSSPLGPPTRPQVVHPAYEHEASATLQSSRNPGSQLLPEA